jgi:hypothetical protein
VQEEEEPWPLGQGEKLKESKAFPLLAAGTEQEQGKKALAVVSLVDFPMGLLFFPSTGWRTHVLLN